MALVAFAETLVGFTAEQRSDSSRISKSISNKFFKTFLQKNVQNDLEKCSRIWYSFSKIMTWLRLGTESRQVIILNSYTLFAIGSRLRHQQLVQYGPI